MARPLNSLVKDFNSSVKSLERTRIKNELLFSRKNLNRSEIEQVYAALFLNVVIAFESLIENIFLGLLSGKVEAGSSRIVRKVHFDSDLTARDVVLGGRHYVKWLPYKNETEDRAKIFFRNGLPFTALDNGQREILRKMHYIRNALAHKSRYSSSQFEKHVIAALPLIEREKKPGGFLRSQFRTDPIQTRYENYIIEIASIAAKLCNY